MHAIDVKAVWRAAPFGIAGITLAFVLASSATRAAMFGPSSWRALFMLTCIAMAALPWLLLSRTGRRRIGLQRPGRAGWAAPTQRLDRTGRRRPRRLQCGDERLDFYPALAIATLIVTRRHICLRRAAVLLCSSHG